jgi:hypothetical protein
LHASDGLSVVLAKFSLNQEQTALAFVLVAGLLVRVAVDASGTEVNYPTEIFQYYEQAHRLAFGSGVVPFEYDYGIRSWLLPGLLAGIMRVCRWVNSNPLTFIYTIRFIATVLSLVPLYCGYYIVLPRAGLAWATITGLFCAVWHHSVFASSSVLPEILASYAMFPAVLIADNRSRDSRYNAIGLGALLGLAFCLRLQMAPALFVIVCWYCRLDWRQGWLPVSFSAIGVVCLIAGLLDWVTLGTPFQSIWLNYYLNVVVGISKNFGQPSLAVTYVSYIVPTGVVSILVLLWLSTIGAFRAPLLALSALAVLVTHAVVAHREYRFIIFFLLSLPILIGLGASALSDILRRRAGVRAALVWTIAITAFVPLTALSEGFAGRPFRPAGNAGVLHAFSVAHSETDICGLGIAGYFWAMTGGYTYFDRNVPIYFSSHLIPAEQPLHYEQTNFVYGPLRTPIPLRMHVVSRGRTIPQLPGRALLRNTTLFNYLIVAKDNHVHRPGYSQVGCFENERGSPWPTACLLRRDGGCRGP